MLLTIAANALVRAECERSYNAIWGSQIGILEALNVMALSTDQVMTHDDGAAEKYPAFFEGYTFQQYVFFLTAHELIMKRMELLLSSSRVGLFSSSA